MVCLINFVRDPSRSPPTSDEGLLRQIAGCVFDSIFKGKSRNIGGPYLERLVELGFLRFATIDNGKADEPLALLTAASCFSQTTWTIEHFLREALSNTHDRDKGLPFQQFSTYALALAFKKPKVLSEVFSFLDNHSLAHKHAQLVAARKANDEFRFFPVNISSPGAPIDYLGRSPSNEEETLSWMQNPNNTAFCFPTRNVGPNAILLLRLQDNTVLRVLVSFKQTEEDPSSGPAMDSFRATHPKMPLSPVHY